MATRNDSTEAQPRWRLGRWVWERCSARGVRSACLALVAVALVLGYTFPQAPRLLRSDPVSYQDWSSRVQTRFREWTPLLKTIGLFWVQDTVWFRVLCLGLAFVLLLSIGRQVADRLACLDVRQPAAFYGHTSATAIDSARAASQVLEAVHEAMRSTLGGVTQHVEGESTYLLASRGQYTHAAKAVLYGGLLCVVVALLIDASLGWQQQAVQLLPGELVGSGPRGTHQIQLVDAGLRGQEARLRTARGEAIAVRPDRPTWQGLYRYRAVDSGSPLVIVEAEQNGHRLALYDYAVRPEPAEALQLLFPAALSSPEEEVDRLFIVSEVNAVGRLRWLGDRASPRAEDLAFYLWVFAEDGQTVLGEQAVAGDQTKVLANVASVMFQFTFSRSLAIEVSYWPGLWLLGLGALLTVAGFLASLMPGQRMWAVVSPRSGGTRVMLREQTEGLSYRYRRQSQETLNRIRVELEEGKRAA